MADANEDRFFVTIRAGSLEGLAEVRSLGLDLFGTTAKAGDEVTIEGLLTLEDVGRVVTAGHEVVVHRHADTMARAQEQSASAEEWLAEIGGQ